MGEKMEEETHEQVAQTHRRANCNRIATVVWNIRGEDRWTPLIRHRLIETFNCLKTSSLLKKFHGWCKPCKHLLNSAKHCTKFSRNRSPVTGQGRNIAERRRQTVQRCNDTGLLPQIGLPNGLEARNGGIGIPALDDDRKLKHVLRWNTNNRTEELLAILPSNRLLPIGPTISSLLATSRSSQSIIFHPLNGRFSMVITVAWSSRA